MQINITQGDVIAWCEAYTGPLFHAAYCDPPYHLDEMVSRFGKPDSAPAKFARDGVFQRASKGFLHQTWDGGDIAFRSRTWQAIRKVLHPGGFLMAFASSRGWSEMAMAIQEAGFTLHPTVWVTVWVNGQGFPKARKIDGDIDAAAGMFRRVVGQRTHAPKFNASPDGYDCRAKDNGFNSRTRLTYTETDPASLEAQAWAGHRYGGQALRPVVEPVIIAQAPYAHVSSQEIYQATGWDYWHTTHEIPNTPLARLQTWKETGLRLPDKSHDVRVYRQQRKALHPGVTTVCRLLVRPNRIHRSNPEEAYELGVYHKEPHKPWTSSQKTACMLVTGAGAYNIQAGRIPAPGEPENTSTRGNQQSGPVGQDFHLKSKNEKIELDSDGRWPANFLMSHHPDCRPIDRKTTVRSRGTKRNRVPATQTGIRQGGYMTGGSDYLDGQESSGYGFESVQTWQCHPDCPVQTFDESSDQRHPVSRFYYNADFALERLEATFPARYVAKAGVTERERGLNGQRQTVHDGRQDPPDNPFQRGQTQRLNTHPTIKPLRMLTYLASLLRPPDRYEARLFEPFGGAGSGVIAALLADWDHITSVELQSEYIKIAEQRVAAWQDAMDRFGTRDIDLLLDRWQRADKRQKYHEQQRAEQARSGQLDLFSFTGDDT